MGGVVAGGVVALVDVGLVEGDLVRARVGIGEQPLRIGEQMPPDRVAADMPDQTLERVIARC
jgi:hypothetical protein